MNSGLRPARRAACGANSTDRRRRPLVEFMLGALAEAGCTILHASEPDQAPFVVALETASGERMGIVAYAFLATRTLTKNRPEDERSFQLKYGSKESYGENLHELWQDPMGMFTTLLSALILLRASACPRTPSSTAPLIADCWMGLSPTSRTRALQPTGCQ